MPLSLEDILLGDAADPYASLQEAVVDPFQNLQQIQAQNQQLANLLQSKEQRQAPLQIPIPTLTPE